MKVKLALLLSLLLAASAFTISYFSSTPKAVQAEISLQEALSDESGSFLPVLAGRGFEFPQDHGHHSGFKTEWWYFTGNLKDPAGERFAYQLTLFRVGLGQAKGSKNPSSWSTDSLFMGHLGLSRPSQSEFFTFERLSRESLGISGVKEAGEKIWLEDWVIERVEGAKPGWRLRAKAQDPDRGEVEINLSLEDTKPPVLQGDGGYSRKGPKPEHASYYVSQTRLRTQGQMRIGGETFAVEGSSWFDHEWSSQAMAEGLVGWDWFSLQLDDETELMLYLLRYQDGRLEPASSGSLVGPEGQKRNLQLSDFQVETLAQYRSQSGSTYPSLWRITVPSEKIDIQVKPVMAEQVMTGRVPYWEGAVDVMGSKAGEDISGVGFVELTGY